MKPRARAVGRSRAKGRLPTVAALVLCAGGLFYFAHCGRNPDAPAPTPEHAAAALGPQLAAYLPAFLEAVKADPRNFDAQVELGLVYEANEMYQEAATCFETAANLNAGEPLAMLHLATVLMSAGEPERAYRVVQDMVRQHPDFAPGQHKLGVVSLQRGEVGVAQAAFERVIALAPESKQGYIGSAAALVRQGKHDNAIAQLETALAIAPADPMANFLMGQAYRGLNRREEAERYLQRGGTGSALLFLDDWTMRLPAHAKGLNRQMHRGIAMLNHKRYDVAEEIFSTVLLWYPENIDVMNNLAIAYGRQDKLAEAIELLERAAELNPGRHETFANLANDHFRLGHVAEAVTPMGRAVELAPTNLAYRLRMGAYLDAAGRPEEALDAYREAVRIAPQDASARSSLGRALAVLGRYREAHEQYVEASKLAPDDVSVQVGLAEASLETGVLEDARAAFQAAKELDADDPAVIALGERLTNLAAH